jgi:quinol monooxygenase YgiN
LESKKHIETSLMSSSSTGLLSTKKINDENKIINSFKKRICCSNTVAYTKYSRSKSTTTHSPGKSNVFARLTKYEVKPEFQQPFRKAISDNIFYSLQQKSNILAEGYYEQDKPSVLWVIERWNSKEDFDKSQSSHAFKAIDSLAEIGLQQSPTTIDVKDLEPLSKTQWRSVAAKADTPITIMLFVDSKPGTEDVFEKVYHAAMPAFRSETGVINYQLSRFESDNTKFVTYEKFRSDAAF